MRLRVLRLNKGLLGSSSRVGLRLVMLESDACDMVDVVCGSGGRVSCGSIGCSALWGGALLERVRSLRAALLPCLGASFALLSSP